MTDYLRPQESQILIFKKLLTCHICTHTIFIPYETYKDVEKPGIQVVFVHHTAICQQCGFVMQFGDPSYYDAQHDTYHWALHQKRMHEPPQMEEAVPVLGDETVVAQKRCVYWILRWLIQQNEATSDVLNLYEQDKFIEIAKVFEPKYKVAHRQLATQECLVILLSMVMNKQLVDANELINIVRAEGYEQLESYIKERITLNG